MEISSRALFDSSPDPMWIFDVETLRFLEVNDAALQAYGHPRAEFLAMTLDDIRPPEEADAVRQAASGAGKGLNRSGPWRHRRRSGEVFRVEITSHGLVHAGRRARLVVARDVTGQVAAEAERRAALAAEARRRQEAEALADQYRRLVEALPGCHLVLEADARVVAAGAGWLAAMGLAAETVRGQPLPALLPPEAASALRAALDRLAATGAAETVALPWPGGGTRRATHTPLRGADGRPQLVLHQLDMPEPDGPAPVDLALRSQALEAAQRRLLAEEAALRQARRAFGLGHFRLVLPEGALQLSEGALELLGLGPQPSGHDLGAWLALLHPADRDGFAALLRSLPAPGGAAGTPLRFGHRILRGNGSVVHLQATGEVRLVAGARILDGVLRDASAELAEVERLTEATGLLRIAGQAARVGGWRLVGDAMEWSAEAAAIFGAPRARRVSLDQALEFYRPEARAAIRATLEACRRHGRPFDETADFAGASGRGGVVRLVGGAVHGADGSVIALQGAVQDVTAIAEARRRADRLDHRLTTMLETMPDGFLAIDGDGRVTFANRPAERLLGQGAGLAGRALRSALPAPEGDGLRRLCEEARAARETRHATARMGEAWLQLTAHPVPDGLALHLRDVTRERADQQELRLLQAAVARMNDILLITEAEPVTGPDGPRIVYVNDAFVRRTGFSREEAVGLTPRILQGPATDRAELDRIRAALQAWQPIRSELVNYTRSGEPIWLELDIVPLADETGWFTHWVAIERDISDRRRAEEALRTSEERLRLVARATNDMVWDADLATGAVWWNDNGKRIFGETPGREADRIQGWMSLLHPEDRDRVLRRSATAIEGGYEVWQDEYRLLDATGRIRWIADRAFILRDAAGRARRMVGSMADVTEQRELDTRLRQAQKLEAIGQLTGGVAHDFNNLLTIILGNAELLAEELADQPELRQMAELAATAAERGAELTNRLLAFARRQALEPRAIEVGALAAGMQAMLRRTLGEHIQVSVVRGPDPWPAAVDPGQLEVALLNLAINARDAMPQGGRLTLETANAWIEETTAARHPDARPGPHVAVSVTDTGSGMAPDVLARAFEPFFTTKEVGKGSGLGLSMVYGFVRQSGGHARIYSEPGHGTVVRLYLPRATAGEPPAATPAAEPELPRGHEHVLVVEDDPMLRDHAAGLLRGLGYRVTLAAQGLQALDRLRAAPDVELMFTDIVMPGGMDGAELAELAQAMRRGLKVLFASGYSESAILHRGRLDPGVNLLRKPYRRQELALRLRRVLDS